MTNRDVSESVLTPGQLAVLEAVLDRLIPSDELGPGAREARVSRYVVRRLTGPYAHHRESYVKGLARLDAEAGALYGAGFAELAPELRDGLLRATEAPLGDPFFDLVLTHAMEGMFGDPSYGGNANLAGWRLIGYLGVRYVWTERDQQLGTTEG